MSDPPSPGFPALLLLAALRLAWRQVVTRNGIALGQLHDEQGAPVPLVMVAGSAPGAVEWAFVPGGVPRLPAYLLTADAAAVLASGKTTGMQLLATWAADGDEPAQHIAELVKETAAS